MAEVFPNLRILRERVREIASACAEILVHAGLQRCRRIQERLTEKSKCAGIISAIHRNPGPQRPIEFDERRRGVEPVEPGRKWEREGCATTLKLGDSRVQEPCYSCPPFGVGGQWSWRRGHVSSHVDRDGILRM